MALVLSVAPVLLASIRTLLALELRTEAWAAADRLLTAMDAGAMAGRFDDVLRTDDPGTGVAALRSAALAAFGGAPLPMWQPDPRLHCVLTARRRLSGARCWRCRRGAGRAASSRLHRPGLQKWQRMRRQVPLRTRRFAAPQLARLTAPTATTATARRTRQRPRPSSQAAQRPLLPVQQWSDAASSA